MDKFRLLTIDNTISDTNADVSFAITCDNPNNNTPIKYIEIDLQSLADIVEWSGVLPAIVSPVSPTAVSTIGTNNGQIRFTFISSPIKFVDRNNRIEFSVANLYKKEGQSFPSQADIRFKLKTLTNATIGTYPDDYVFNTIQVSAEKPVIESCKINPSITRESTDVTITYETINAGTCELKDAFGKTINLKTNIDKTKPFRFSGKIHLGSMGTSPNPPFYLHAREGAMEAVDNTVANVIKAESPDWFVMDNFSREVEIEVDGIVTYILEQYTLLDLILNESDDMMWAIMQKRTDLAAIADVQPCIWKSPDGVSWMPHTYIFQYDSDQQMPVDLTIPPDLVHCPCVHFGEDELYFVGGSKVDINVCKNTITVVNLKNGGIYPIDAPAAMKPRCMHACVVYPDSQGNDNIWVIGGADKNGNGLNDVWRFDGHNWIAVPTDNAAFPKRCRFAATVQTDVNGAQSIWIGGGAARYNGSTLNDLWVYNGTGWVNVRNADGTSYLSYSEDWLTGVAICYLRTNKNSATDPSGTYRYILSSDISGSNKTLTSRWILGVDIGNNCYKWNPIDGIKKPEFPPIFENVRSFTTATIGFNGCVWTVIIGYISKGNLAVSNLYYSCPVP
jgi:hypothetical protein